QAPEVLQSVGVDLPIDVRLRVVDDAVDVGGGQTHVRLVLVGEHRRAGLNVLTNNGLEDALPGVRHDLGADGAVSVAAVALQQAHHGDLAFPSGLAFHDASLAALVHETGASADEGLVHLDLAAELSAAL